MKKKTKTVCEYCGLVMGESDSCIKVPVQFEDGSEADPIPFVEHELVAADRGAAFALRFIKALEDPDDVVRCHDCGVLEYGFHHKDCEAEICPVCKKSFHFCHCTSVMDGTVDPTVN